MVSLTTFHQLAMGFPEVDEQPHFEKKSYRTKKKIFATLDEKNHRVVVKLSPQDQYVYCRIDADMVFPVTGSWGIKGWTAISLKKINQKLLKEMVALAYETVRR